MENEGILDIVEFGKAGLLERTILSMPFLCLVYDLQGNLKHVSPPVFETLPISPTGETLRDVNVLRSRTYGFYKAGAHVYLEKVLAGKTSYVYNVPTDMDSVRNILGPESREYIPEFSTACVFPIYNSVYEVTEFAAIFFPQSGYTGSPLALRCREWIDEHWRDQLDMQRIGKALNVSGDHVSRIFKKTFGMTPIEYHRGLRYSAVKEALCDADMSVKEAFASCGIRFNGSQAQIFKRMTGYSPGAFRRLMCKPKKAEV